jgi:hypothetical protein
LIAPLKQDLIGGRAVTIYKCAKIPTWNFQVKLDEIPNILGSTCASMASYAALNNQFPLLVMTADCFESRHFTCRIILL